MTFSITIQYLLFSAKHILGSETQLDVSSGRSLRTRSSKAAPPPPPPPKKSSRGSTKKEAPATNATPVPAAKPPPAKKGRGKAAAAAVEEPEPEPEPPKAAEPAVTNDTAAPKATKRGAQSQPKPKVCSLFPFNNDLDSWESTLSIWNSFYLRWNS